MDVVVNAKFKDSLYYKWAMWMMNGPRKTQPKSGNFIAASCTEVLSWCAYARDEVKMETILSGVEKCYMSADPGEEFEVEAAPETMEIEDSKDKAKKEKKNIVAVKSKSVAELQRLATKKERARKKIQMQKERARKKLEKQKNKNNPKQKATPKRKPRRKSPNKRVVKRRKTQRKKTKQQQKK